MTELHAGIRLPGFSQHVDAASMKVFSLLTCDPNPIHWDPMAVKRAGLGDSVVNQGGLNAAYLVNAVNEWLDPTMRITSTTFRFVANSFAGDMLIGGGAVVAVEEDVAVLDVWLGRSETDVVVRGSIHVALTGTPDESRTTKKETSWN